MNEKVNHLLVGLFVLLFGAAGIFAVLWFSSGGLRPDYERYLVYTRDSVSGLTRDSAVLYQGVPVGRVASLSLVPGNPEVVRLLLEVEEDTPIKVDTRATLEMQGLTGIMRVNLIGGTREAAELESTRGEPYPVIVSEPSLLGRLDAAVSQLIDQVTETSMRINTLLSDENLGHMGRTFANIETVTELAAEASVSVRAGLDELKKTSQQLPELAASLTEGARALERMAQELAGAGAVVRQQVEINGNNLSRFTGETLPEAAALVDELRQASENFRQLSETLLRDPSTVLYGEPTPTPGPGER